MLLSRKAKPFVILATLLALIYAGCVLLVYWNQRSFLYFPSHRTADTALQPWIVNDQIIGYCRPVAHPRTVWLMTHGNGGQADGRAYVLRRMSAQDSLYVVEYPGYGLRLGETSKDSINRAATEAYAILRATAGQTPVCVIGESLGSGPASFLGTLAQPPDKIVLVVPFDSMVSVAGEHMPWLPVRFMLKDDWNNLEALKAYAGSVEIYGAIDDQVIGYEHARKLAAGLPKAKFVRIDGGHNEWSDSERVRLEP